LNEDEVDEQVSGLKRASARRRQGNGDAGAADFGFRNASFTWNSVLEREGESSRLTDAAKKQSQQQEFEAIDRRDASGSSSTSLVEDNKDRKFELRDLNVIFPPGELTVVTGPTASGKTALLVSR
jgi:ABC-type transport system involved in cytochrome bd biosynthesis fused ATPase/permease subunit